MPETPIWLLSRGRYEDAEKSLCWLRGWVTPDVIREEFNQLVKYENKSKKMRRTTVDRTDVNLNVRDSLYSTGRFNHFHVMNEISDI
jgi:hypothetical protein